MDYSLHNFLFLIFQERAVPLPPVAPPSESPAITEEEHNFIIRQFQRLKSVTQYRYDGFFDSESIVPEGRFFDYDSIFLGVTIIDRKGSFWILMENFAYITLWVHAEEFEDLLGFIDQSDVKKAMKDLLGEVLEVHVEFRGHYCILNLGNFRDSNHFNEIKARGSKIMNNPHMGEDLGDSLCGLYPNSLNLIENYFH